MNTEQERAKLLPCPFCGGGKTEVRENGRPWLGTRWGEPVSVSVRHWCEPVDGQPSRMIERVGRDRAAAIAAWNRRAALQSQSMPPEISRDLLGKIVDEVFDGAIEDASVIEDIYRVVARECALQSQDAEDAERYRWLRDGGNDDIGVVRGFGCIDSGSTTVVGTFEEGLYGEQLDAAIDHARLAEGESNG